MTHQALNDQYETRNKRLQRVGSLTHVELGRFVITEMSRADSLSDAVNPQAHFGRSHPE